WSRWTACRSSCVAAAIAATETAPPDTACGRAVRTPRTAGACRAQPFNSESSDAAEADTNGVALPVRRTRLRGRRTVPGEHPLGAVADDRVCAAAHAARAVRGHAAAL